MADRGGWKNGRGGGTEVAFWALGWGGGTDSMPAVGGGFTYVGKLVYSIQSVVEVDSTCQ